MRALSAFCLLLLALPAAAEDYPTQDTVEMVIMCMFDLGAQNEQNLYTCVCRHDLIKSRLSFKDYENARLVERYRDMPGKKGQIFRDDKEGEKLLEVLEGARKDAAAQCPQVKHIEREPPTQK